MQRLWSSEELAERWSLGSEELVLLLGKPDAGKLGLAVQLAFYKQYARFPEDESTLHPRSLPIWLTRSAYRRFCWMAMSGQAGRDDGIDN